MQVSKIVTDNLTKYIKTLESKCHENEQYLRGECLEISSIPSSTEDSALEDTNLRLFRNVNVLINPSNHEDCRRLKSRNNVTQKVIIKLSKEKMFTVFSRLNWGLKMLMLLKMEFLRTPLYL